MLFLALFAFVLVLFAGRLFVLQIVDTKGDTDNAQVYSTVTTVRAARGDILDRNGNVLVGNRASCFTGIKNSNGRNYGSIFYDLQIQ